MNQSNVRRERALGTMARVDKGPIAPAPALDGPLGAVAKAVAAWPGISATSHWHLFDRSRVDGVDFYLGGDELGHLHLEGSLHLATSPSLGMALIAEGRAVRFPYQRGWVCADVNAIGEEAAIALFRRNYDAVRRLSRD